MAVNEEIRDLLPAEALILERMAYDNSIIGITLDGRLIYSFEKMVEELQEDEQWTAEEAIEWIEYNTIRALPYMGEKAPLIVYTDL